VRQKKINDIPADAEPEIPGHRGKKDRDKTAEEKAEEVIEWDYLKVQASSKTVTLTLKYAETPEEWEEMHRTTTEDANGIACMTALAIALTTWSFRAG